MGFRYSLGETMTTQERSNHMLYSIEGLRENALRNTVPRKIACENSRHGDQVVVLDEAVEAYRDIPKDTPFDIFLSYRSLDADVALDLVDSLETEFGYKVYLDRRTDPDLKPSSVNRNTAECIRDRLRHCSCLIYASTVNSGTSQWMPWEAGFMDGQNRPVAILPIEQTEDRARGEAKKGLEFLSLYPYVSKDPIKGSGEMALWVNEKADTYCLFDRWLKNHEKPHLHIN